MIQYSNQINNSGRPLVQFMETPDRKAVLIGILDGGHPSYCNGTGMQRMYWVAVEQNIDWIKDKIEKN